jgi:hypothetical protein
MLPLKCDIARLRHNLTRPGLCPECLGDEDAEPEDRFRQLTNVTEWKTHVLHHLRFRGARGAVAIHDKGKSHWC